MLTESTIEEYQKILMRNPSAKVFAPLSEAYRKMGLLQQALEICETGVRHNSEYPSGLVAYGKVLFELENYREAADQFAKASKINPDNLLAKKLQALSLTKMGNHPEALAVYKQVLFLSPSDSAAKKFITKWEYLEAQGYDINTFVVDESVEQSAISNTSPEQISAFVEALIARNELVRAKSMATEALKQWPNDSLLQKQLRVVSDFLSEELAEEDKYQKHVKQVKKQLFERILRRMSDSGTVTS